MRLRWYKRRKRASALALALLQCHNLQNFALVAHENTMKNDSMLGTLQGANSEITLTTASPGGSLCRVWT